MVVMVFGAPVPS
ncbi:hypothetical protein E2C01_080097 [Portunus trituberculatus]|uniref:Uncharacterized protein n=1 Tax=Portunus trituberculatus TaxID=210409 RepID=A0A5B7IV34_PORTR|nr:hypothetical protein [Portunus trituberculatus]